MANRRPCPYRFGRPEPSWRQDRPERRGRQGDLVEMGLDVQRALVRRGSRPPGRGLAIPREPAEGPGGTVVGTRQKRLKTQQNNWGWRRGWDSNPRSHYDITFDNQVDWRRHTSRSRWWRVLGLLCLWLGGDVWGPRRSPGGTLAVRIEAKAPEACRTPKPDPVFAINCTRMRWRGLQLIAQRETQPMCGTARHVPNVSNSLVSYHLRP
jgi:hypothetical protein